MGRADARAAPQCRDPPSLDLADGHRHPGAAAGAEIDGHVGRLVQHARVLPSRASLAALARVKLALVVFGYALPALLLAWGLARERLALGARGRGAGARPRRRPLVLLRAGQAPAEPVLPGRVVAAPDRWRAGLPSLLASLPSEAYGASKPLSAPSRGSFHSTNPPLHAQMRRAPAPSPPPPPRPSPPCRLAREPPPPANRPPPSPRPPFPPPKPAEHAPHRPPSALPPGTPPAARNTRLRKRSPWG